MKILIVNYEFPPVGGGASKASFNIARELVKLGHDIHVITSRYGDQLPEECIDGIRIHRVFSWRKGIHDSGLRGALSFLVAALPKLRSIMSGKQFDIVHYFFGLPTGLLSFYSRGVHRVPYIISLRGSDVPGYDCSHRILCTLHAMLKPVTRKIWRKAAGVVTVSKGLRLLAQKTASEIDIRVIHNGVKIPPPDPVVPSTEDNQPVTLLCVARLIRRKGIDDLLQVMATIDSPSALLRVVGDGPTGDELRRLCNDLGLGDRVEFMGYRSPAELEGIYATSDIFVLPTHSEAFANVVLEAMSWGLPVVSTRVGGCPEVIDDGVNGILVDPGDIPAMAAAIMRLLDNAELRRSFGARNKDRVRSSFSWRSVAAEYEMLFEEVVWPVLMDQTAKESISP